MKRTICGLMKTKFHSLAETVSCVSAGRGLFPVGERLLLKMQVGYGSGNRVRQ